jgi:HK97 family phage prohead protease
MTALAERAACSALYWARRKDSDAVRGSVAGLAAVDVELVKAMLSGGALDGLSDFALLERMTVLAMKSRAGVVEKHIVEGDVAKTAAVEAPADAGWVEGYASAWRDAGSVSGADRQGEVVRPGAYARSAAAINAGAVNVPLIATAGGHEFADPQTVVGQVVRAVEDGTGLWIRATWNADPVAQRLRVLAKGGGLSFSVGGAVRDSSPVLLSDGTVAKQLNDVDLFHVMVTSGPANSSARIITAKDSGSWLVVDWSEDVAAGARRNNPDVARRRAEEAAILEAGLPVWVAADPELRAVALHDMQRAALAKSAAERPADPVRAAQLRRQARDNTYSSALAAWQAEHAGHRRCRTGGGCDE